MEQNSSIRNKAISLGVGISIAYTASYVAKTVLSGIMPSIITTGAFTKTELGDMGSAFMLAYGIGQLVNGIIGDLINPKKLIFTGLFGAGALVLLFPLFSNPAMLIVLWGLVGFLCSMLWGPLSKIVAENTENKVARILMLMLTAASILGKILAFIICALVSAWKNAFILAGIYIIFSSVFWFVIITYMEKKRLITYKSQLNKEGQKGEDISFKYLVSKAFIPVMICIMLNGVIRNAVSNWIPTYITEEFGLSPAFSSAISIINPIISLVGTVITFRMLKVFNDNEHILSCMLFAFSAVMYLLILLFSQMVVNIASMFMAEAAMSGVCNILFSVYVLRFSATGRTSGITGTLDFSAYMTSSLANRLIGLWTDKYSWNFVITGWLIITVAGAVTSYISHLVIKRSSTRQQ